MSAILLVLIFLVSYAALYFERVTIDSMNHSIRVESSLDNYLTTVREMESGQRGFLLTMDSSYMLPYDLGIATIGDKYEQLATISDLSQNQIDGIKTIKELADQKTKELALTIRLVKSGDRDNALEVVKTDEGKELMQNLEDLVAEVKQLENKNLLTAREESKFFRTISNFSTLLGLFLIFFLLFRVRREVKSLVENLLSSRNKLKSNNASLALKNEQLENFTYVASHDLKEPLRTISNFTNLLKTESSHGYTEEEKTFFSFIDKGVERMNGLVEGLHVYARLGSDRSLQKIDVAKLVKELDESLRTTYSDVDYHLNIGQLPSISGYKHEISHLFQNLLSNAIKFRRESTSLTIDISCEEDDRYWKFAVEDNGIGIPLEKQEMIFNFLTKLHRTADFDGQGLGLAYCNKVATLHDGSIRVETNENSGSTFHIKISKHL